MLHYLWEFASGDQNIGSQIVIEDLATEQQQQHNKSNDKQRLKSKKQVHQGVRIGSSQVQSLLEELRSCNLRGKAKIKINKYYFN